MKKRILSLLLSLCLLGTLFPATVLASNDALTRAEAAEILYDQFRRGMRPEGNHFADLEDCSPRQRLAINALAETNILSGTTDGRFMPHAVVSRGEAVILLSRFCDGNGHEIEQTIFNDTSDALNGALREPLNILVWLGVLTEADAVDGKFKPSDPVTAEKLERWASATETAFHDMRGIVIVVEDNCLVSGGKVVSNNFPAGMTYNEETATLTLNNASFQGLRIEGKGVTVVLEGNSTARPYNDQEPFMLGWAEATITGPGSLNSDSGSVGYGRAFVMDNSSAHITGGAKLYLRAADDRGLYGAFVIDAVHSSLIVDGGSLIEGYSASGISISGQATFENCTVRSNAMSVSTGSSENPTADPSITVKSGAKLELVARREYPKDKAEVPLGAHNGGVFIIDGGEVIADATAWDDELHPDAVYVGGDGSVLDLRSGSLTATIGSGRAIRLADGAATLRQSGGTLVARSAGTDSSWQGIAIEHGASAEFTGGTADISGMTGIVVDNGSMTVSGGKLTVTGTEWNGLDVNAYGSLTVMGGETTIKTESSEHRVALMADFGPIRFLGGNTELLVKRGAALHSQSFGAKMLVTMGAGMFTVDKDSNKAVPFNFVDEPEMDPNSPYYNLPYRHILISNSGGAYSGALSLTSGEAAQGAPFNIRADIVLGEPNGIVTLALPEGVAYRDGTLSVDGRAQDAEVSKNDGQTTLTTVLHGAGTIRFSATAVTSGEYTVTSTAKAGTKMLGTETLAVKVEPFALSLPSSTDHNEVRVSGSGFPGSTIAFYASAVGQEPATTGTATVNSIGTWSGTLTLPDTKGTYSVYAQISGDGITTFKTNPQTIVYDPETAEAKSLTISNYIHGKTDLDPPEQTSFTIDFLNNTTTGKYYIYWPDLPTLTFTAEFTQKASSLSTVRVRTTDRQGTQTLVYLNYDSVTDKWIGSHDFNSEMLAPQKFRVEYQTSVYDDSWMQTPAAEAESDAGSQVPAEDETTPAVSVGSLNDTSDGVFLEGDNTLTFEIIQPYGDLVIVNSAGKQIAYRNQNGVISFDENTPSDLYKAYFANGAGSFVGYPNAKALYIHITGGTGGSEGTVTYTEQYRKAQVRQENAELAAGELVIRDGDVYVVQQDGSQTEAQMEDVYEELHLSASDLKLADGTSLNWQDNTLAAAEEFRNSDTYILLQSAVYAAAADRGMTLAADDDNDEDDDQGVNIEVTPTFDISSNGLPELKLEATVTLSWKFNWEYNGNSCTVNVILTLTETNSQEIDLRLDWEDKALQRFYFTIDQTDSVELSLNATIDGSSNPNLSKFFETKAQERILDDIEVNEPESKPYTLGELYITTPSGLLLFTRLEVDFGASFSGELTGLLSVVQEAKFGVIWDNGQSKPQVFYHAGSPEFTAEATLHVLAQADAGIKARVGVSLIKMLEVSLYGRAGLTGTFEGHGKTNNSGDHDIEIYAGLAANLELGAGFAARIPLVADYSKDIPIVSQTWPLWEIGLRTAPYRFTTVEGETLVTEKVTNLQDLISMDLYYMDFKQQTSTGKMESVPKLSKKFESNRYEFDLISPGVEDEDTGVTGSAIPNGTTVNVSKDGTLSLSGDLNEEFSFYVKLTYTGHGENYEICKAVLFHYIPDAITIIKSIEDGASRVAGYTVKDLTNSDAEPKTVITNDAGIVIVPVVKEDTYQVTEIFCAHSYYPLKGTQNGKAGDLLTFVNIKDEDDDDEWYISPEPIVPVIKDPSGFVYEGTESNRLSGVTATLYFSNSETKPTENATAEQKWNATEFDQINPLTTDTEGQYLWMVPDGWWQIKFEKEGYNTVYSDWLPVPPIQTDVNVNMTSTNAAALEVGIPGDDGSMLLRFERPVAVSDVTTDSVFVFQNGKYVNGGLMPIDSDWTENGVYATTFLYWSDMLENAVAPKVYYHGVSTYMGTTSNSAEPVPEMLLQISTVQNGVDMELLSTSESARMLVAAAYDSNGRMLDIVTLTVGSSGHYFAELDLQGAKRVTAFLLDGDTAAPCCEKYELELQEKSYEIW